MARKQISSGSSFEEIAGYSRAIVQDNWCFVSGTTGYDYIKMELPGSLEQQVQNTFETIDKTLIQAGFQRTDIVRARYYVTDRANVGKVFDLVGAYFKGIKPAATMVISDLIEPEMKIEIDVTALKASS
ncbi:MAG: RidA family protein [Hyphomicrobiales bacterium]